MSDTSAHRQRFKEAQAVKLRDGILEMRYSEEITDFKVMVGSVAFKVHRLVLAASSPYFKAMLSHNMKETIDGEVVMKEVTPGAIKACIEFMYAGEVDLSQAEISDILYAAAFMQLDLFLEFCREYLEENIGINTALHARRMACAYGFENVELESTKFIEGNIKDISSSDQFLSLSVDEVAELIKILDADKETMWLGVINWIRHDAIERTDHLARLLTLYSESNIKLESFILSSWSEVEVKHSKQCREIIQERLVKLTPDKLALITKTVCCQLKEILQHCELDGVAAINDTLNEILISNFVEISRKNEFKSLLYGDVATCIQKNKCSEEVKWEAILKWTKAEKQRKSRFPDLFRLLNFDAMPVNFIEANVRNEILVRKSSESMALLMDAFVAKVRNGRRGGNGIPQPPTGSHLVGVNNRPPPPQSSSPPLQLSSNPPPPPPSRGNGGPPPPPSSCPPLQLSSNTLPPPPMRWNGGPPPPPSSRGNGGPPPPPSSRGNGGPPPPPSSCPPLQLSSNTLPPTPMRWNGGPPPPPPSGRNGCPPPPSPSGRNGGTPPPPPSGRNGGPPPPPPSGRNGGPPPPPSSRRNGGPPPPPSSRWSRGPPPPASLPGTRRPPPPARGPSPPASLPGTRQVGGRNEAPPPSPPPQPSSQQ